MSSPSGIDCALSAGATSGSCTAQFPQGTVVTLQTEPAATSVFLAFSGDCAQAPCTTTMQAPRAVTATFVPNYLSVVANAASVGSGHIVSTPAGIDCTLSGTAAGTGACSISFPIGTVVTLTQEPIAGAIFSAWSSNCVGNPCAVTMGGQRTVDVTYRTAAAPGSLTVGAYGAGSGVVTSAPDGIACTITNGVVSGTCSANFPAGVTVALTAVSATGGTFSGFTGACAGPTCSAAIVSGAVTSVNAGFTAPAPPVTLTVAPSAASRGSGTITSVPAGLNCTVTDGVASGVCAVTLTNGTVVSLTQTPDGSSIFQGWGGDCIGNPCQVTMTQARVAEVTYRVPPAAPGSLTVGTYGAGSGVVTSVPSGIICSVTNGVASGTCLSNFPAGVIVSLTAVSAAGGSFSGFSGACSGSTCTTAIVSGAVTSVNAGFTAPVQAATLVVAPSPASRGSGTLTSAPAGLNCTVNDGVASGVCAVAFANGTVVSVTQIPNGGSIFQGWSGDCIGNPCQVTMTQARVAEVTYRVPPAGIIAVSGSGTGTGSVTSSPSGIACTISAGVTSGTCSATFSAGASVTLIGGSTNNGSFDGFSGACTGSSCVVQSVSSVTTAVTAAFSAAPQRLTVTAGAGSAGGGIITSQPAGINCVLSGSTTSGTCTAFFAINTVVTLQETTSGNAVFSAWGGDCTSSPCQLILSQGRTALATFQTQGITITGGGTGNGLVTSSPAGITCTITAGTTGGTCATTFAPNTVVTLTSTPSGLSSFSGYTGACSGTTCTVSMVTGTMTSVTVQFAAPPTLSFTAATGSQGGGTLTSAPSGIACTLSNTSVSGTCTTAFALNTAVTVTQTPANGSVFMNWAGACTGSSTCQVALSQSRAVQALYRLAVPGSLTIMSGTGTGNGSVSSSPGGIACVIANGVKSGICRAIFPVGSTVTLIPVANTGFTFTGFSGSCSGMTCTLTIPENGDLTVTANFTP